MKDAVPAAPAGSLTTWPAVGAPPPTTSAGAFQQQLDLRIRDGANAVFEPISIPDGLHLVIEFVSVYGSVPAGQMAAVSISTTVAGSSAAYHVPIAKQDTAEGIDMVAGNQILRLYADPPSAFVLITRVPKSGDASFSVSVSGYFVGSQ